MKILSYHKTMRKICNILIDFGGVFLPEGNIDIKKQLTKVFSYPKNDS